MNIAIVAPLVSPIHDDRTPLGGAQGFVGDLCHWLAEAGHQVTLLAADGSLVRGVTTPSLGIDSATLTPAVFAQGVERTDTAEQTSAFGIVRSWLTDRDAELDVVHAHAYDAPCFSALESVRAPVLHTLHLPPIDPAVVAAVRHAATQAAFVGVSQAGVEQWQASGVPVRACIYPGLDLRQISFEAQPGRYLLFAGRLTPEKGVEHAITMAEESGWPLILAGEIYDRAYFERIIQPRVHEEPSFVPGDQVQASVTYVGARSRRHLLDLMSHARGLLMPSLWDEPFGLVGVEAQATGTPVVAFRRGGLTEVVSNGETGWLVEPDDDAGFLAAIRALDQINRTACRARVQALFSHERTLGQYLATYEDLCSRKAQ